MKRLRIADCELRIRRGVLVALALQSLSLPAHAIPKKPTPTPTPGIRKLTGGFGRSPEAPAEVTPAEVAPSVEVTPADRSLGDTVRVVRERTRKEKATVAITNRNLVTDPKKGRLTTASPPKAEEGKTAATPAPGEVRTSSATAISEAGEAFWREKMRS